MFLALAAFNALCAVMLFNMGSRFGTGWATVSTLICLIAAFAPTS